METIKLHDIQGISRISGIDDNGCCWIQFQVDYYAQQEPGQCVICGATLEEGWACMDGGDEVCSDHIEFEE